jgi:hypothetical protein
MKTLFADAKYIVCTMYASIPCKSMEEVNRHVSSAQEWCEEYVVVEVKDILNL